MSSFNKCVFVGRLTRDPDARPLGQGGLVAKFGLAVDNRKKAKNGDWVNDPMFIDVEAYNRGNSTLAQVVSERLLKGNCVLVEGKLFLDQWDDKQTGQKRSRHKLIADNVQFLDGPNGQRQRPQKNEESVADDDNGNGSNGDEIPF